MDATTSHERGLMSDRTTIGVPKESTPGERRVALVPDVVRRLGDAVDVVVEPGAGAGALIPDELYESAGARLGDPWGCDVVVKVAPPTPAEIGRLRQGAVLIGFLDAPETRRRARDPGHHGVRDGGDPADQPRAGRGRAVVAVDAGRLQGRDPRRGARDPAAADDDHRRRHAAARPCARAGRRRRRTAGLGDRAPARRADDRLRRPARDGRAGRAPSGPTGWSSASRPPARAAMRAS